MKMCQEGQNQLFFSVKMGDFETAGTSFGEALELARKLKNKDAEESIEKVGQRFNLALFLVFFFKIVFGPSTLQKQEVHILPLL